MARRSLSHRRSASSTLLTLPVDHNTVTPLGINVPLKETGAVRIPRGARKREHLPLSLHHLMRKGQAGGTQSGGGPGGTHRESLGLPVNTDNTTGGGRVPSVVIIVEHINDVGHSPLCLDSGREEGLN
jgi:hypothetical protein